jgi:hypothetical protein
MLPAEANAVVSDAPATSVGRQPDTIARRRLSPQGALRWRLRARKRPQWFRPSETGILGRSNALLALSRTALTEAQKAEEAHLRARFDVFSATLRNPDFRTRGGAVQE